MAIIKKAIVRAYDSATHSADVQIVGSLGVWLAGIRVATNIAGVDVVAGRQCAVLFLDPANQDDAVLISIQDAGPAGDAAARVYNSGNLSIPDSTWTALTFDTERWDTDGLHSTVSNTSRLTASVAGKYVITATVHWAGSATGRRLLRLRLNGATTIARQSEHGLTTDAVDMTITTEYDLAAGDYVEIHGWQNSGGALNILGIANHSPEFAAVRVAPASSAAADPHGSASHNVGVPSDIGAANAAGSSALVPRLDHVHNHPVYTSGDLHNEYAKADGSRAITGRQDFSAGLRTDTIEELTATARVTFPDGIKTDVIEEATLGAGITIPATTTGPLLVFPDIRLGNARAIQDFVGKDALQVFSNGYRYLVARDDSLQLRVGDGNPQIAILNNLDVAGQLSVTGLIDSKGDITLRNSGPAAGHVQDYNSVVRITVDASSPHVTLTGDAAITGTLILGATGTPLGICEAKAVDPQIVLTNTNTASGHFAGLVFNAQDQTPLGLNKRQWTLRQYTFSDPKQYDLVLNWDNSSALGNEFAVEANAVRLFAVVTGSLTAGWTWANRFVVGARPASPDTGIELQVEGDSLLRGGNLTVRRDTELSVTMDSYVDNQLASNFFIRKARGSESSPAAVQDDDRLGSLLFGGHDGSGFVLAAGIFGYVDGTVAATKVPARFAFEVTKAGDTSRTVALEIMGDTGVRLPEQASAPAAQADSAVFFAQDNGSGKTQLMVQFPTGAAQQVAIEA